MTFISTVLSPIGDDEFPLTCVCSPVSLQLITPGESLSAEHPVADEGSLSAVPAKVGPEVRRLPVHLATASNVAYMLLLLPHTRTPVKHEGMKGEPPCSQ